MWSSNKVFKELKYSEQYIQVPSKNWDLFWIWYCFQSSLHCLVQPNQFIHFLFHMIFIIRIRLFTFFTYTFYASEILLYKVFINACKLAVEMPIDWSYFLCVWHPVNPLSVSVTDWNLSWSSIQRVCLWQSFTLTTK